MRRLMKGQVDDVKEEWTVLEDTILDEDTPWQKAYPSEYREYLCYISVPTVSEPVAMGNSMIFGSGVVYYKQIGDTTYSHDIFVHILKVTDSFVFEENGSGIKVGLTGYVACSGKKQDERFVSNKIATAQLPKDTHIYVFAR